MNLYRIDIPIPRAGAGELELAGQTLTMAAARRQAAGHDLRIVIAGRAPVDGWLVAFVEAGSTEAVHGLFAAALLPVSRIIEVGPISPSETACRGE